MKPDTKNNYMDSEKKDRSHYKKQVRKYCDKCSFRNTINTRKETKQCKNCNNNI